MRLFKTLQTVYGPCVVVSSQETTVRQSREAAAKADLFSAGRVHKLKVNSRHGTPKC